jgi:hypothetical protein
LPIRRGYRPILPEGLIPPTGPDKGSNAAGTLNPLSISDAGIDDLVEFLKALTDERVQCDQAPFDHPELLTPVGHDPVDETRNGRADDIVFPAAGDRRGRLQLGLGLLHPEQRRPVRDGHAGAHRRRVGPTTLSCRDRGVISPGAERPSGLARATWTYRHHGRSFGLRVSARVSEGSGGGWIEADRMRRHSSRSHSDERRESELRSPSSVRSSGPAVLVTSACRFASSWGSITAARLLD